MKISRLLLVLIALTLCASLASAQTAQAPAKDRSKQVHSLKILVLSTMVADSGIGEWGYAAVVEADGNRILFDTGARDETVLTNAKELNVDLASIKDVILSHNHDDHTGGLLTLRRKLKLENRGALSVAHVGKGIFWSRPNNSGEANSMIAMKAKYEAMGGKFVEHAELTELYPGVWLTGAVPRVYPERNWSGDGKVKTPDGLVEDNIPEELSLIINTDKGLVVLSGCGHAGIINTLEFAHNQFSKAPIYAAVGGFHLFDADDKVLDWTGDKLKELGAQYLLGGHCTGIEAVYHLRQRAGLNRQNCVVSSVGSSFTLDKGIDPLDLAK
jgi:7,8-dihydropterin-6-yl-methyl-4-(beta-D-ribofuranosyl)aminobenzene 5'-phosphate synthase